MNTRILFGLLIATLVASTSFAQEATKPSNMKSSHPVISQQNREKLATFHEKMAVCLRSDRPFHECRSEFHERCASVIGREGCPMMSEIREQEED